MSYSEDYFQELIADAIDIGSDHWIRYTQWSPDRELNPQYDGVPDVPKFGLTVWHRKPDGTPCCGGVHFDLPEVRAVEEASRKACEAKGIPYGQPYPMWQVVSWEPLTLSPSLLCKAENCGDHGFIRDGRWVRA